MRTVSLFLIFLFAMAGCASPDRSKALVVIDAGHGGHDTGAISDGKFEKDLVLSIAKRVKQALRQNGHPVYLTRGGDRFLKLGQRTRIADKKGAMIFLSIHANASPTPKKNEILSGVETYYLQKSGDARSQHIAERENAAVLMGTDDLSKDVIIDAVLNGPKIVESHKLAIDVQREMLNKMRSECRDVKDGGVRAGPFYVLVGASRPSILVEVGYLSNTKERQRLFDAEYQNAIAKGIASGIGRYLDNRKKEIDI
ncbi:N-acetylmuramoyl-L-alanine amidase [Sulfurovum sp. zt1-1]|uniref:N-acetylmuramoyl-L-alanine amidase n=1 Tax=Sulfurovum zhangzhouensis TaxID=3019067 RepID=A0ABT7QW58_9BACT|nr:N-acetylmuramoyl-L-alanine amidase [Sulfurovum zhangzhouensis]MDM5271062.1 N-acetylmuramoyl-L-alanine amidase [Sulfurovum zhangzhouensis]